MATFRTRASGTIEACIRRKQLGGPVYLTFRDIEEARRYCQEAEAMIDAGNVPHSLVAMASSKTDKPQHDRMAKTIGEAISTYLREYPVKDCDCERLSLLRSEIGRIELSSVTVQWALALVKEYKEKRRIAPSTIRHRVGALRRCLDWHVTTQAIPINPLKLLPSRYASYSESEAVFAGREISNDNARDRRLEPGEEDRIRRVLSCDKDYIREIGVERGIDPGNSVEMSLLFDLAIETAMRMREMITLTVGQIDIERKTIFLDKTKNGDKRQVPMSSVVVRLLSEFSPIGEDGRLFSFWRGDSSVQNLRRVTWKISHRWALIARLARCDDLRFHDLRHEATSRLFERTTLSDLQIAKITGHRDIKMLRRYSNLRGSDLAERMW